MPFSHGMEPKTRGAPLMSILLTLDGSSSTLNGFHLHGFPADGPPNLTPSKALSSGRQGASTPNTILPQESSLPTWWHHARISVFLIIEKRIL
jgi:hypothetical protein